MCTAEKLQNINKQVVNDVLNMADVQVNKIILFGSYARQEQTNESDIDYMVILDMPQDELRKIRKEMSAISEHISFDQDVVISILARDKNSFEEQKESLPLYQNILREGEVLYG